MEKNVVIKTYKELVIECECAISALFGCIQDDDAVEVSREDLELLKKKLIFYIFD